MSEKAVLIILGLVILLFSVIIHEVAHGWVALKNGDDTAQRMGRLTLNPIEHIDPVGTIIVPLVLFRFFNVPFGWAKPVPVDGRRLNNPARDMIKVAAAGPLSNILLATLAGLTFRLGATTELMNVPMAMFLILAVKINLVLAFFNLMPIYPLDGSRVMEGILPSRLREKYRRHMPYGIPLVFALAYFGVFGWVLFPLVSVGERLLLGP